MAGHPGRSPTYYRLTETAADFIERETGNRPTRIARSSPPSARTILHRVGMARVVLAMNDACSLHGLAQPEWFLEYDSVAEVPGMAPFSRRFHLCHQFVLDDRTKLTCWPDAGCSLTIPHNGTTAQLAILWEFDRSTETLQQLKAKMPPYAHFFQTHAYRKHWPAAKEARIFFIVPSLQRLENAVTALRTEAAASIVRLATVTDMKPDCVLTKPIWSTVDGQRRSILPG